MRDCPNAELRDQLPAYVHGRLDAAARAAVDAHLAACADCAAEVELLRSLWASLSANLPAVDTEQIVAALPKAGVATATGVRWRATRWRAAAVLLFMAGASSVVLINTAPAVDPALTTATAAADAFSFAGGVSDLSDADLKQLLSDVDQLDALPAAEPDDVGEGAAVAKAAP